MKSFSVPNNLPNNIKRYRKKNFPFNLTDNLKCVICCQILLNAIQTDCGCRYCKECLEEHLLKGNRNCLSEGCGDFEDTMPDKAINKEIGKLIVKCLFKECKHKEMLKDIGNHLDNCKYQTITCPLCEEDLTKNMLDEHLMKYCKMRIVKCTCCGESMTFKKLEEHLNPYTENLCPILEGECPYKCDVKGMVKLLHHRKECSKKPVTCPYSEVGCLKVVTQENLSEHINNESEFHSRNLIAELKRLKKEISDIKNHIENIDTLKMEFNKFKIEILTKISDREKLSHQLQPVTSITRSNDDKTIYRNGVFIWKVERFSELKSDAERGNKINLTSNPFYTKEFGYKMSMKIYPAGDGVGKSTHLSVFFTLMKGEFDDLLPWPFKNKVTLTILDQKNKTTDHSDTFKPDPRSTCYQQPTDEYNIASGSPKFILFSQLQELYLKNDTIFLKIVVLN